MKRSSLVFLSIAAISFATAPVCAEGLLRSDHDNVASAMILAPNLPPAAPLDQFSVENLPPGIFDVGGEMLLASPTGTDTGPVTEFQVQGHWDKNLDRIVFSLPPGMNPSSVVIQRMKVILRYFNGTMERYFLPAPRPLQQSIQLGEMRPS